MVLSSFQSNNQRHLDEMQVDWSKLPEELVQMIAVRSFSSLEFKRFRSICTTWRSSAFRNDNPHSSRALIKLSPLVLSVFTYEGVETILNGQDVLLFISRASFFRVTLSSSSSTSQGWLIKSDVDINLGKIHLIHPLSRFPFKHPYQNLDLLKFTVTEIGQGNLAQNFRTLRQSSGIKKVILVTVPGGERVLCVGWDGKIRYWNGVIWTRIKNQTGVFSDIVVYRGITYALDTKGFVWWISSSLSIFRYGSCSLVENMMDRDMSLVGCGGELYIIERLLEINLRKRKADTPPGFVSRYHSEIHDDFGKEKCKLPVRNNSKTVGFKVYKMDEALGKWVQVNSLEDNAVFVATDACFSVVASEYYGCLPNAIYCTDKTETDVKVFKVDDGSGSVLDIEQISFQMFAPTLL